MLAIHEQMLAIPASNAVKYEPILTNINPYVKDRLEDTYAKYDYQMLAVCQHSPRLNTQYITPHQCGQGTGVKAV